MPRAKINATRMELLRLKRRAVLAKKGHKLLKDKLDGLVQQIMAVAGKYTELQNKLEKELVRIFQLLVIASAETSQQTLAKAVKDSNCQTSVETSLKNIMGVRIPAYSLQMSGDPVNYSFSDTPMELDAGLVGFQAILPELVKLAEYDRTIQEIATQVIEIKRRVNALEYILIPELESAVREIKMKLAEMDRSSTVALLKIKEMVRAR